jgi:hypothetical protein
MRFINRNQPNVQLRERGKHLLGHQPFRREIEKPGLPGRGAAPRGNILRSLLG